MGCKECLISFKSRKNVTSLDHLSDSLSSNMDRNADSPKNNLDQMADSSMKFEDHNTDSPGSTVDQKADSPRDQRADSPDSWDHKTDSPSINIKKNQKEKTLQHPVVGAHHE